MHNLDAEIFTITQCQFIVIVVYACRQFLLSWTEKAFARIHREVTRWVLSTVVVKEWLMNAVMMGVHFTAGS